MNPHEIVKWLEVVLLVLILGTGGIAASVYISGTIFHSGDEITYYHLEKDHWKCLEYKPDVIPREDSCVLYRRSF